LLISSAPRYDGEGSASRPILSFVDDPTTAGGVCFLVILGR
jgi:hypothetical protein